MRVSTVQPGYIATPHTAKNNYGMIGLVSLESAVETIRHGVARNVGCINFPLNIAAALWLMNFATPLRDVYSRNIVRKTLKMRRAKL